MRVVNICNNMDVTGWVSEPSGWLIKYQGPCRTIGFDASFAAPQTSVKLFFRFVVIQHFFANGEALIRFFLR